MTARIGNIQALEKQFRSPLDGFDPIHVSSAAEAETIIESLQTNLESTNDDWSIRYNTLKEAMRYLSGTINRFTNADYNKLSAGIARCIIESRSALVKLGSLLIAAAAMIWKDEYVNSIELLVQVLLKQVSHGTLVIAGSCRCALLAIARNVQHRQTCMAFLAKIRAKSAVRREVVAEALVIIRNTWQSEKETAMQAGAVEEALFAMRDDVSVKVRQIVRGAMGQRDSPDRKPATPRPSGSTLVQRRKTAEGGGGVHANKTPMVCKSGSNRHVSFKVALEQEKVDISTYMPPKTRDDADAFVQLLREYIEDKDFEPLVGLEEFLPNAVINAVRFVFPEDSIWNGIIPVLLSRYAAEFGSDLRALVIAFEVSPWLMDLVIKEFDGQLVFRSFGTVKVVADDAAFHLYTAFFSRCLHVEMDHSMRIFLEELADANDREDDVCLIETALEVNQPDDPKYILVKKLVDCVKSGERWTSKFGRLAVALSANDHDKCFASDVQSQLLREFRRTILWGTNFEVVRVSEFIGEVCLQLKGLSFADLTVVLVERVLRQELEERGKTEECILRLMRDPLVSEIMIEALNKNLEDETCQLILNLLLRHLADCSLRHVKEALPSFMRQAPSLMAAEVVAIRRLCILIVVELKCKAPKDFMPFGNCFTAAEEKLISLYCKKHRVTN